jgi:ankyrin repeat protein
MRLDSMLTIVRASETPAKAAAAALDPVLRMRRFDLVKELVQSGADLDAPIPPFNEAPLSRAMLSRDVEAFRQLLDLGADPERARISGQTLEEFVRTRPSDPALDSMGVMLREY